MGKNGAAVTQRREGVVDNSTCIEDGGKIDIMYRLRRLDCP